MTVKELIAHLTTFPEHLEIYRLDNHGDPINLHVDSIVSNSIDRRSIFLNCRPIFTETHVSDPLKSIEAVVIDRSIDRIEEEITVGQCLDQLRAYPLTHKVVYNFHSRSEYLCYPTVEHICLWKKNKITDRLQNLYQRRKTNNTTHSIDAVVIDCTIREPAITVSNLIKSLEKHQLQYRVLHKIGFSPVEPASFRKTTIYLHNEYWLSTGTSEHTIERLDAVCIE